MIITYLEELLTMVSPEAIAEALGLRVVTLESLALGMYLPEAGLLQEIKSLYGMANYLRLKEAGIPPEEANRSRYTLQLKKPDTYQEALELITKIAQKEQADPNLIRYGLMQSEKSWDELKDNYAEITLDMDFFNTVKNEVLYI